MHQVSWTDYANAYDLMARNNPAYQELLKHCLASVCTWPLSDGNFIADIGGGTGNFSVALALALPSVTVLHVDSDEGMLSVAQAKANRSRLANWKAIQLDVTCDNWSLPALKGVVTVHGLYTFKTPSKVIKTMCSHLLPRGHVYACDIGRVLNITDWTLYLLWASIARNGPWGTMKLFVRCAEVRRQNQRIAISQRSGLYWTHELPEFVDCFRTQGLKTLFSSNAYYRGYDDLVIAEKAPAF